MKEFEISGKGNLIYEEFLVRFHFTITIDGYDVDIVFINCVEMKGFEMCGKGNLIYEEFVVRDFSFLRLLLKGYVVDIDFLLLLKWRILK